LWVKETLGRDRT